MTVLFCDIDGVLLPGKVKPGDDAYHQAMLQTKPVDRVKTLINPDLLQEIKARVKNDPDFKLVLLTHQTIGKQKAERTGFRSQGVKPSVQALPHLIDAIKEETGLEAIEPVTRFSHNTHWTAEERADYTEKFLQYVSSDKDDQALLDQLDKMEDLKNSENDWANKTEGSKNCMIETYMTQNPALFTENTEVLFYDDNQSNIDNAATLKHVHAKKMPIYMPLVSCVAELQDFVLAHAKSLQSERAEVALVERQCCGRIFKSINATGACDPMDLLEVLPSMKKSANIAHKTAADNLQRCLLKRDIIATIQKKIESYKYKKYNPINRHFILKKLTGLEQAKQAIEGISTRQESKEVLTQLSGVLNGMLDKSTSTGTGVCHQHTDLLTLSGKQKFNPFNATITKYKENIDELIGEPTHDKGSGYNGPPKLGGG